MLSQKSLCVVIKSHAHPKAANQEHFNQTKRLNDLVKNFQNLNEIKKENIEGLIKIMLEV